MRDLILFGDCRKTLKEFDEKPRMCVTSPPYYGLRDYGGEEDQIGQEQTPEEYINNLVEVFREVRNVLTDDGTCWVRFTPYNILSQIPSICSQCKRKHPWYTYKVFFFESFESISSTRTHIW